MSDPFIGEIRMFAGTFAPRSHAFCDGQLLAISQNSALFSLLGLIYGGDGRTTFGLPEMRGRIPVHQGQGPGLSNRPIGQRSGAEDVTLNVTHIPAHSHQIQADTAAGSQSNPAGQFLAASPNVRVFRPVAPNTVMAADAISNSAGGAQQHDNVMPFTCIHFIIALSGDFPSRN